MKTHIKFALLAILCTGCNRSIETPLSKDKIPVDFKISSQNSPGFPTQLSHIRLFLFKKDSLLSEEIRIQEGINGNDFRLFLPEGEYIGIWIGNAPETGSISAKKDSCIDKSFLKILPKNPTYDYLTGKTDLHIRPENENHTIRFKRKVAKLIVRIRNLEPWVKDLNIKINAIPPDMNFKGIYSSKNSTVSIKANPCSGEDRISTTELSVFPNIKNTSRLIFEYKVDSTRYKQEFNLTQKLTANKITLADVVFTKPVNKFNANFSYNTDIWDTDTVKEIFPDIPHPQPPCQGSGDGNNIVKNYRFAETSTQGDSLIITHWHITPNSRIQVSITEGMANDKAVALKGEGVFFQNIPVIQGKCYLINLYAKCNKESTHWKYEISWHSKSGKNIELPIKPENYLNPTEGWENTIKEMRVRVPQNADFMKISIHIYKTRPEGEVHIYNPTVETII